MNMLHVLPDIIPVKVYRDGIATIYLLEDGDKVSWESGGQHEEGYSYEQTKIWRTGDTIRCEYSSQSQDCDGRLDHNVESYWIEAYGCSERGYPNWKNEDEHYRDHTAESMNY